jgi:protoheme ferro-lyase
LVGPRSSSAKLALLDRIHRWRYGRRYGYEMLFRRQDRRPEGQVGVILADMGMPEAYDPTFYVAFVEHVLRHSLPPILHRLVLSDHGTVLIDPDKPLAREPFEPRQLVDMHGSTTNRAGRPYIDCSVVWRPPAMKRNPWDAGHFLCTEDGPGGAPDVCQKTCAKVAGWYYGRLLPEAKVAWAHQCGRIYEEAAAALRGLRPSVATRHARYVDATSMRDAVEELLAAGCETIVYQCYSNLVYSDLEDYTFAFPRIKHLVGGRAKVIFAEQLGNQPALRSAFAALLRDQLAQLPRQASLLLILSKHGHPFKRETMDERAPAYRQPLEAEVRAMLEEWGGRWELLWSDDEYADAYWDPRSEKLETRAAYQIAIDRGFDYALEIPTEFLAENTDLMIYHAVKKYAVFEDYDPYAPIPYPDWERPLVRTFHRGRTTGIYAGCPVGPYRPYVVKAVVGSVLDCLGHSRHAGA